ncbi:MAG: Rne/Rng family ribonuclease [Candidatus Electrothrix sp. AU1_5]|nr:Rne/Rng family ribonuclease [Candidatus Electrothrix sp. AX1]MCI5192503.1 Rne/Rng family ribonuclease [Candidatus Electrothrix gigas]
MTNETKKETNNQSETKEIRKVTTGAWWKNIKKKKATTKTLESEPVKKTVQTKPASPEKPQPATAQQVKPTKSAKSTKITKTATKAGTKAATKKAPHREVTQEDQAQPAKLTEEAQSPQSVQPVKPAKPSKQSDKSSQENSQEKTTPAKKQQSPPVPPIKQTTPAKQTQAVHTKEEKKKPARSSRKKGQQPARSQQDNREHEIKEAKEAGKAGEAGKKDEPKKEQTTKESRQQPASKQKIRLLINAEEPEECRIAQMEDGRLESFHVNTVVRERTKNNIYKGRIVSIEANLQAAFVEIGTGRNGFLPFSDIHPEYYRQDISEQNRKLINQQQWKKLKIEDLIKRGQEVLVQVVKEVTGNKGANMTTYLSLPGRCLVLMPGSDSAGISRKISGEQRRSRLREIMSGFNIPEGVGYIVRTASAEITKTALQQDLRYLTGLWKEIKKRGQTASAPALVYEDQDTVHRFLRDHFTQDIQEIIVDTEESYNQVKQFVDLLPARQKKVQVKLHRGAKPIFNQNNIEEQIESIYQPQVQLPSGGSIVIDPTEALVAIDVNSGRTSQKGDFEKSIFLANMEAAEELARQLRLRDLGGLIVVDFIDMRSKNNIKEVEKQVKNAMKRDKAKVDISRISRFGLMQISRQKMGAPIEKGSYRRCVHCEGRGLVRSVETLALYYLRRIQTGVARKKIKRVEATLPLEVGQYLLNQKRAEIMELESKHQAGIIILPNPEMKPSENNIRFLS